jgi:threonine dehydrogenase-like Zn-dependent dehydrogenase
MSTQRDSMQALQITGVEQFRFVEMPVPAPQGRQVLIKRLGIVTCNAYDLYIYTGKPYPDETAEVDFPYPPGYPGHEWVAEVVEMGPQATQVQLGDWVCTPGGRGEAGAYPDGPGGYAPYSTIHETRLIRVPKGMDIAKLAPLEMASCVAANILDLNAMSAIEGKKTAVIGLGPAGLIAAQMLRAEGAATILGLDVNAARREYALSSGQVDKAIDPLGREGQALPLRRRDDPDSMIETSIDCAGAPAAIQYLMDRTRDIVSLFAVQHGPVQYMGRPPGCHQGLKLHGYPYRDYECGEYAARAVAGGDIDLSLVVSHTMDLSEYDQALQLIKNQEALKVLFAFDEADQ